MGDILSDWLRPAWMVDPRILGLQAGEYVKKIAMEVVVRSGEVVHKQVGRSCDDP